MYREKEQNQVLNYSHDEQMERSDYPMIDDDETTVEDWDFEDVEYNIGTKQTQPITTDAAVEPALTCAADSEIDATSNSPIAQPTKRATPKELRESLERCRSTFLMTPKITKGKTVFLSEDLRNEVDKIVGALGGRRLSASGFLENLVNHHLSLYRVKLDKWRKL